MHEQISRGMRRWRWAASAATAAILLGSCDAKKEDAGAGRRPSNAAGAATPTSEQSSLSKGAWVPVGRETLRQYAPAVGNLLARQTTRLGTQVSGRVQSVLVDVGERVTSGQELVRIESTFFEIEVAQKNADVEAANVALAEAELNWNRMKNLWEKPEGQEPSVPRRLYDDAKSRHEAARARMKQAEEALRYAQERLRETVIRAPYDAVVTRRMADPGEPVTSTPITHLLEVQQVGKLDLEFSLPQEMLVRVKPGTRVEFDAEGVEVGAGESTIATVFPAIDETTRSFRCRAIVENAAGKFRPGILVRVRVLEREVPDALAVPRRALTQTSAGWEVLVSNDGHPTPRKVEAGLNAGELVEIISGVTEGERVFVPEEKR